MSEALLSRRNNIRQMIDRVRKDAVWDLSQVSKTWLMRVQHHTSHLDLWKFQFCRQSLHAINSQILTFMLLQYHQLQQLIWPVLCRTGQNTCLLLQGWEFLTKGLKKNRSMKVRHCLTNAPPFQPTPQKMGVANPRLCFNVLQTGGSHLSSIQKTSCLTALCLKFWDSYSTSLFKWIFNIICFSCCQNPNKNEKH